MLGVNGERNTLSSVVSAGGSAPQCAPQSLVTQTCRAGLQHCHPAPLLWARGAGRSWHVRGGCCTPTPHPDVQPGHCRSAHPRLAAREHSHLLSLDFLGVIMLWREKEQWPFDMGRGEKGHIQGKVAIILIMEIICKDVNLYFLITAYFYLHIF